MSGARLRAIITGLVAGLAFSSSIFAADYKVEVLVPSPPLWGSNGLDFNAEGELIVGSMTSGTLFKLDLDTGDIETIVPSPMGIADDMAISPIDGTIVWTAMPMGMIQMLRPGGKPETLARDLPMINAVNFTKDGRLFASQVGADGGNLYEIDMNGEQPPRVVMENLEGLNGFEITDENILYGPLMMGNRVVRIDLEKATMTDVAGGFEMPTAVNIDSKGNLYAVDYLTGDVVRIDPNTGEKSVVAETDPPIDNLAISSDDLIYVTHPCSNGIEEINPETGAVRQVAEAAMGWPNGATLVERDGKEELLVASMFCQNYVDLETGEHTRMKRQGDIIWSSWIDQDDETIVISSSAFGQVQWLDSETGAPVRTLEGFQSPYQVEIMPDKWVLVAELETGRLLRLSPTSDEREVLVEGLEGPLGMIAQSKDIYYVTEALGGIISMVNIKDGTRTVIKEGLDLPEGIALLPDGRLVVAEVGAKRLIALSPVTGAVKVLAEDLPIGLPAFMGGPPTFMPTSVAVDSGGAIYVTSDIDHTVLKVTAN